MVKLKKLNRGELEKAGALMYLYRTMSRTLAFIANPKSGKRYAKDPGKGNWSFIPNYNDNVIINLMKIKKSTDIEYFVDLGCGPGNVLCLASALGFFVKGYEYNARLAKIASCQFNTEKANLRTKGSELKLKGRKCVLYLYRPLDNSKALAEVIKRFTSVVKKGSILYAEYVCEREIPSNCRKIARNVYEIT